MKNSSLLNNNSITKREDIMFKKAIMLTSVMILSIGIAFATSNTATSETANESYAMITGSVVDATTGEAVSNATVELVETEASAITDEYGTFVFEEVEVGTYTLSIQADGYQTAEQSVEVAEEGANVEIAVQPEQ